MANARHYPSISWIDSYSEYIDDMKEWWHTHIDANWLCLRYAIMELLQKEQRLLQVVKLVGPDVLPNRQRLILEVCSIFKNTFLQQDAFDSIDTCSSARKQFFMLKVIITFYNKSEGLIKKGISLSEIKENPIYQEIIRMKLRYSENDLEKLGKFPEEVDDALSGMETVVA